MEENNKSVICFGVEISARKWKNVVEYLSFRECTHVHHQKKPVTIKVTGFYLTNPIVKNC